MARKTIAIQAVKDHANKMLRDSVPEVRAQREGICGFMDALLHDAGAYAGFNYLDDQFKVEGDRGSGLREGYDPTRRFYY